MSILVNQLLSGEPKRRWSANLPDCIIGLWDAKWPVWMSRQIAIGTAMHAFLSLSHEKQVTAWENYIEFRRQSAADIGFRQAMTKLGFTVPTADAATGRNDDADGDTGEAVGA